jgi:hypothetical protein
MPFTGPIIAQNISAQNVTPITNNTYDIGSSTFKWRDGWFSRNVSIAGNGTVSGNAFVTGDTFLTGGISVGTTLTIGVGGSANFSSSPLKNATLTGASNGNAVTLLNQQGPAAELNGNSADQTIYTYTIPANTLGQGKGIRAIAAFTRTTGAGNVTFKMFLGATTLFTENYAPSAAIRPDVVKMHIFNNSGVTNAQNFMYDISANISTGIIPLTASRHKRGKYDLHL